MVQDAVIGAFSEADAARLSGVTLSQLKSWDRSKFIEPTFAEENRRIPYSRIYSFRDVVALRVLGQLRNKFGVPLQHLRKVSEKLAHLGDKRWTSTTLFVLGKKVVFEDPRIGSKVEIVSEQQVFDIPLRIVMDDTRKAIQKMNEESRSSAPKIVHGRFTLQNEPVFEGTRIPVATVERYVEAGASDEKILSEYPDLKPSDIAMVRSSSKRNNAA